MQIEGQPAMELHAIPQGGVGHQALLEGGALLAGQAIVEEQVHGFEHRGFDGSLPVLQPAARLEQARVHHVGGHVEHLADRLVLQTAGDAQHQDGPRHGVEARQRQPEAGVLLRGARRLPAGGPADDPQVRAAPDLVGPLPPQGDQAAVQVDARLLVARGEVGRQETADQALQGELRRLRRVAGQVVGQDEQSAAVALNDIVAVGGIRPKFHQAFFGPFPEDLPMARWIVYSLRCADCGCGLGGSAAGGASADPAIPFSTSSNSLLLAFLRLAGSWPCRNWCSDMQVLQRTFLTSSPTMPTTPWFMMSRQLEQ